MKTEITITLFLFGSIEYIVACSGPGALEAIRTSIEIGNYCAFGSIGLTLLSFGINRKHRTKATKILLSISILLTILHPGFWISAVSGDCGMMRLMLSKIITTLIALILLCTTLMNNNKKLKQSFNEEY